MRHLYAIFIFFALAALFMTMADLRSAVGGIEAKLPYGSTGSPTGEKKSQPIYLLYEIKESKKICKSVQWCFIHQKSKEIVCSLIDPKLPDGEYFKLCEAR